MMDNITSSAPPPIDNKRPSLNILLISQSKYPWPPQYCKRASDASRANLPAFNFAMLASNVASFPFTFKPTRKKGYHIRYGYIYEYQVHSSFSVAHRTKRTG